MAPTGTKAEPTKPSAPIPEPAPAGGEEALSRLLGAGEAKSDEPAAKTAEVEAGPSSLKPTDAAPTEPTAEAEARPTSSLMCSSSCACLRRPLSCSW